MVYVAIGRQKRLAWVSDGAKGEGAGPLSGLPKYECVGGGALMAAPSL